MRKETIMILGFLLLFTCVKAQMLNPVKWSYAAKRITEKEVVVYLKAVIEDEWHIYSVNQKDGGPLKTTFKFTASPAFSLIGKVTEPKPISKFEEVYGIRVDYFEKEVVFQQKLKLKETVTEVKGKVSYMACTDERCTPPLEVEFSIQLK